ncbi:arf-GAP domain and FG repeat-containing protein 1-like [Sinocyclocheilus anshuiensis]|uniref:arf-GAP domain and FG repeat-containing protein 1-like n=1 Tax=Sinocyclocheilus anshuiensis TaxID=1608454 RepID=UPI0007B8B261|nr:PREDICTED: arf-GAP domain and FG repeat-containing protein 1-like [Sinocyclocheilus anshuiensis]
MAASAKRKQEEKHLKMLREMTSLPPNRKCFDCDQRGPTYANMTVGSFVCTTCSGILRGLNPPHRVKSISMTTFTQQEIEFLQKHSNEVCKHIWLGLYDDKSSVVPDFREPQKVKEFLQEKYEKKRCMLCFALRGLNPPHRVKSISMTTFTQQEIEFLQKHSNEVCKHIWLGLYDDKSSQISVNLRKSKSFFRRNMRRKDADETCYSSSGLVLFILASFGTGSMSMPAGFGNTTSYCLPTSFSGTFQQQFPGQGPFPPPAAYHQQPNGGFPAYGQAKPMGNYGQVVTGPGISSNPFMGGGPAGPYPTGGSSTNPFL